MNNSPMTDPEKDTSDRSINAHWRVGEPDAERWQAMADLWVRYDKGAGYRATLSTHHRRPTGRGSIERTMNVSFDRCHLKIHSHKAARFNRKVLAEVYDTALRALRERFESADEAVTVYFDAATAVFDYSGRP